MATYCPEDGGDSELFSCPICFEDYDLQDSQRAPKLLLCLHTFCSECTKKLWKNGSLECSMCRMLHEQVRLEDLFDNPVIVQHLKREREEQDLEYARKIDQELRSEYGGSPVMVSENNTISEEHNDTDCSIVVLESTDENIEADEADETDMVAEEETGPVIANMDDDDEEPEQLQERNDCQSNIFNLLESLRVSPQSGSDIEEENEDHEEDENEDDDIDVVHEEDGEGQDDNSSDDSGPPLFCFDNVRDFDDDHEDSEDEVEATEEMNDNPTFMMDNIQCLFGFDNDDEDEDDERFHSACDDISTVFWGGDEDLPMHEGSEEDTDNNGYCWRIVNPEALLDD